MRSYELEDYQGRVIISCLEERRESVLMKFDKIRKMKYALNDDLYGSIMQTHSDELQLITETIEILTLKS